MQHCIISVVIPAPVDRVWEKIGNFYDLSWAKHFIQDCKPIGSATSKTPGMKRLVNGLFEEVLVEYKEDDYFYVTRMENGPPPVSPEQVSNYTAAISLIPMKGNKGTYAKICAHWETAQEEGGSVEFFEDRNTLLLEDLASQFRPAAA